jgi:hypothetical protein
MLDLHRPEGWLRLTDAVLVIFDVLEEAIDPASWPAGWELQYTDRPQGRPWVEAAHEADTRVSSTRGKDSSLQPVDLQQ